MPDQGTEGFFSPFLRKKRIHEILPYLRGRVLDIGCGTGCLANHVAPDMYVGVDSDEESVFLAKRNHPTHLFLSEIPESDMFDTIVLLAVIEHIPEPVDFLKKIFTSLKKDPYARLCLTTPHPRGKQIHKIGAKLGLCSSHAAEEHEALLERKNLEFFMGDKAKLEKYHSFLFGLNQFFIFKWSSFS